MKKRNVYIKSHGERLPASLCPHCGVLIDATTGLSMGRPAEPEPGCLTICGTCGGLSRFREDLTLELPPEDFIETLHPDLQQAVLRLSEAFAALAKCERCGEPIFPAQKKHKCPEGTGYLRLKI